MAQSYKFAKGFTLVELLVVISIVAILTTVGFVVFSNLTSKTRDTRRSTELDQIAKSLEIKYSSTGRYPIADNWIKLEEDADNNGPFSQEMAQYFTDTPRDPLYPKVDGGKVYSYQYKSTSTGDSYKIHAEAEQGSGVLEVAAGIEGSALVYSVGEGGWSCGQNLTDSRDSQIYETVLIGAQCWLAKNLNIGSKIIHSTAQSNNGVIEKYCANNDSACTNYGGLYRWDEAMQYVTTPGAQGICMAGWHIPTHDELTALERSVCTSGTCLTDFPLDTTTVMYRGTTEGDKLKKVGLCEGRSPCATSSFNGVLGGYVNYLGSAVNQDYTGTYWSSTQSGDSAWTRYLILNNTKTLRYMDDKLYAYSLRCTKN